MSLWQMTACIEGYKAAHNAEPEAKPPSADDYFEQVARLG